MRGSSGEVAMETLLIAESAVVALAGLLKPLIGGSRIGVWPGVHSPSPASGEGARRDEYYSVPDIASPTEKRLTTN